MDWAMFPPWFLIWGQSMVEVIKIMATSFKRSCAHTAVLSAPNLAPGHHWPTPLREAPGHSWASLAQSLVGSLLLSPRSWCTQDFVCALQEPVSPVLCMFWWLYGEVNGDLLQEGLLWNLKDFFLKQSIFGGFSSFIIFGVHRYQTMHFSFKFKFYNAIFN